MAVEQTDKEQTVAEAGSNGQVQESPGIQLDPMAVINEIEQFAPQVLELAKERVARKLLEQQNRQLMRALQEQAAATSPDTEGAGS